MRLIGLDKEVGMEDDIASLKEGFPSGQRDQTVNLTSTTSKVRILLPPPYFKQMQCGYSLVVEPQPSKLMMRVRFPLPAPIAFAMIRSCSSVGRAHPW